MFVRLPELIADIGRDAGLDSARADTNQAKTDRQHGALSNGNATRSVQESEGKAPETIDNREPEDGSIFPEPAVGNDRADDGKVINAGDEIVGVFVSLVRRHRREHA